MIRRYLESWTYQKSSRKLKNMKEMKTLDLIYMK